MVNKLMLRSKIVGAGHTQKSLAEALNMSKNTLSAKINGRSAFDICEVADICSVLGIENDVEKAQIFLAKTSQ